MTLEHTCEQCGDILFHDIAECIRRGKCLCDKCMRRGGGGGG